MANHLVVITSIAAQPSGSLTHLQQGGSLCMDPCCTEPWSAITQPASGTIAHHGTAW